MELKGKYGATANIAADYGIVKHSHDGFTLYATIEPYGDLFKQRYVFYNISQAKKLFRDLVQEEVDKYFVAST
tara:strand:- start:81 stop:299 length:219 start_codon:yes stop_codon:yes gene_type:complete